MGKVSKEFDSKNIDFRELVEISHDSICGMDTEGRITFLKGPLEDKLGEKAYEIVGRALTDFLSKEDIPQARDMIEKILSGEPFPPRRFRVRDMGDIYSFEMGGIPVKEGGKVAGIAAIVKNITEIKERKRDLKELKGKFLDIAEVLGKAGEGVIALQGIEGGTKLIFANSRVLEMLGYEADADVEDIPIEDIFDSDVLKALREHPDLKAYKTAMLKSSREKIPIRIVSSEISLGRDRFQILVLRGITEMGKIENALRESEEKYRAITENSLTAIYIFQDEVFKYVNKRFEELIGYSKEEIIGKPFWEFVHPDDREMVKRRGLCREEGEGVIPNHEIKALRKDGSTVLVEIMSNSIDYQGRPAVFGNLIDITQRRLLEEQLRQVQKIESLGTLTGGIAHDFNNILLGILGYSSLLKTSMDKSDPRHRYVDVIERSATRASELTKRLLSFARSRKHTIVKVNLNRLISEVVNLLSKTLTTPKPISIKTELEEGLWPIGADEGQMHQVIMNLCMNASESMSNGGMLTIKTENVEIDREFTEKHLEMKADLGKHVKITISDTGAGMDENTLRRIFDPFFTTKKGGTGLGLSVVYGIAKDHNGYIDVRSDLGKGTTFELYFPVSVRRVESEKIYAGKSTVLLVDDEDVVREVGKDILENSGYRVVLAGNGQEAASIYGKRRGNIDLVILDMVMPDMDGKETFSELKKIDPDVKVLLSSGYSVEEQVRETLRNGALGFIRKPYSISDLTEEVGRAIKL